mmetsp:Transcript_24726/g.62156  ORF Transcript_24726/g.62156 Transcript_24726/m.62156 type:complete len:227 (-) Transcript_24726:5292-5972(-)
MRRRDAQTPSVASQIAVEGVVAQAPRLHATGTHQPLPIREVVRHVAAPPRLREVRVFLERRFVRRHRRRSFPHVFTAIQRAVRVVWVRENARCRGRGARGNRFRHGCGRRASRGHVRGYHTAVVLDAHKARHALRQRVELRVVQEIAPGVLQPLPQSRVQFGRGRFRRGHVFRDLEEHRQTALRVAVRVLPDLRSRRPRRVRESPLAVFLRLAVLNDGTVRVRATQ